VGTTVTVHPIGQPTTTKTGKITGITPRLLANKQFDSQLWSVWVEVRNPESDSALFPGQKLMVQFPEFKQP
jgi:hypothetical protein